jgi:hypothetical protein
LARERWLDDWKTRLLDCPHSHSTRVHSRSCAGGEAV